MYDGLYDELSQQFLEEIKDKYKPSLLKRFKRVIKQLLKTETDFLTPDPAQELKKVLFRRKSVHHPLITETTYLNYMSCIKIFFKWLKDAGYINGNNGFENIKQTQFRQWYLDLKAPPEKIKKRLYTTEELLKVYEKYLRKTYENYQDYLKLKDGIKRFIVFMQDHGYNFYRVNQAFIERWKEHLFKHQHRYKAYYTAYSISRKIHYVKRFYEWFCATGYREDNPLGCYNAEQYKNSIREKCQSRPKAWFFKETVPERFKNIYQEVTQYEESLNLAEKTIQRHQQGWLFLFKYLEKKELHDLKQVDESLLIKYQVYLSQHRKQDGTHLSLNVISRNLISLKRLFYYLARGKYISHDPSVYIELPRNPRGLPTEGINERELRILFETAKGNTEKSIRDRAILEALFSTGVRRNELCHIKIKDIDFEFGVVRVNVPKGGVQYQRVIPIGKEACRWIQKYLREVRSGWSKGNPEQEYLFLNQQGNRMEGKQVLYVVKSHVMKAKLRNHRITTHSFRVACATGMLKGKGKKLQGASIKWVQEQLGHTSIATTEKYLRLVPSELKRIHEMHHPRERAKRYDKQKEKGYTHKNKTVFFAK